MAFQKFGSPEDVLVLSKEDDEVTVDDDVGSEEDGEEDAPVQE